MNLQRLDLKYENTLIESLIIFIIIDPYFAFLIIHRKHRPIRFTSEMSRCLTDLISIENYGRIPYVSYTEVSFIVSLRERILLRHIILRSSIFLRHHSLLNLYPIFRSRTYFSQERWQTNQYIHISIAECINICTRDFFLFWKISYFFGMTTLDYEMIFIFLRIQ